jgi:hypothetical protein
MEVRWGEGGRENGEGEVKVRMVKVRVVRVSGGGESGGDSVIRAPHNTYMYVRT